MSPETKLLVLCYLILFLYFFFAFIYSRDRLNLFRDQLQAIRVRLLVHVRAGDLRSDSYAYHTAQTIVTGVLRYASCYSIPLILFHCSTQRRWIRPGRKRHLERRFRDALEELSPAGRAAVKEALDELHFRVLSHVLHVSVLFWLPLQIFRRTKRRVTISLNLLQRRFRATHNDPLTHRTSSTKAEQM